MSLYYGLNKMNGGIHLDQLKIKKMAKPQQNVIVRLKSDNIIIDRRDTIKINRQLVMDKINKHLNIRVVEKKQNLDEQMDNIPFNEFKIPIIENISHDVFEPEKPSAKLEKKITIEDEKEDILKTLEEEIKELPEELTEELPEELPEELTVELPEELPEKLLEKIPEEQKEKIKKKPKKIKIVDKIPIKIIEKEEETEEKQEIEKEDAKKRTTRKIYEKTDDLNDLKDVKINRKLLLNRLPKKEKFIVKTSDYYMNNRKIYIQKIAELFRPYKKEILESSEKASCDTTGSKIDFKLLFHQKVVRDYLNLYTPYRGLLLYHMLGSGKTCSSIAIAEGMKSERKIVLMTPASLKMNFFSELKKCGDVMYKKNQYWEFISIEGNPDYVNILSRVLQISEDVIRKKKGAWLVDVTKKEPNFSVLDASKQKEIDEQLDLMIRAKYLDINYNGINMNKLKELTDDFTKNPFDNTTILIDEAHNFVSRIVNKIKNPKSLSYMLYQYLMRASNAKIVLISGTPIINYPNELAIMFNILRGYIKKWTFQLAIKNSAPSGFKVNKDEIMKMFEKEGLKTYDYLEYSGNKLSITRNPYGFINTKKKLNEKKKGGESGGFFSSLFGGKKANKTKKEIKIKTKKNVTKKNIEIKDHYKIHNSMIQLLPKEEEDIELESTIEYNDRIVHDLHKGGDDSVFESYNGVTLDETGNISDEDFIKEVKRILAKNYMEIVNAGTIYEELKALPDDSESFLNLFVDQENTKMKNENVFKKRILGLSSYFRSAEEKLLPSFVKNEKGENYHIISVEMSEYQFSVYEKIRKEEADDEKRKTQKKQKMAKKGEDIYNISSTYRIFSRAACNFAFPDPPGRPMPNFGKETGIEMDENVVDALSPELLPAVNEYITEEDVEEIQKSKEEPVDYMNRIKKALEMIKYDKSKTPDEQYLTANNLGKYSNKFLKILENIKDKDNTGLHLLYSQFRTIEGIGILKLVLEANGFSEFKIKKNDSNNTWTIVENEDDIGKPKFVLYTGTETPEEKEIIRNIYNSSWELVPISITSKLSEKSSNNFYGEIIKVLMITASGAEGINLKNTRFVHIVEPYWHQVRIDQVIGRARRICSHQDLPEELRTVKVFLYISIFTNDQMKNKKNIELMNRDVSRITGKPNTTDESLLDTAIIKTKINNELLDAIKETSIDCNLYSSTNKEENLVCYGFGKVISNQFASYPTLEQDMGELQDINIRKQKIALKLTKEIDGVKYLYDPKTFDVYDSDAYNENEELIVIGKIVKKGKGFIIEKI